MMRNLSRIVDSIYQLPNKWHTSGSVHEDVLSAIARLVEKAAAGLQ